MASTKTTRVSKYCRCDTPAWIDDPKGVLCVCCGKIYGSEKERNMEFGPEDPEIPENGTGCAGDRP
jgi:hypothetical protein